MHVSKVQEVLKRMAYEEKGEEYEALVEARGLLEIYHPVEMVFEGEQSIEGDGGIGITFDLFSCQACGTEVYSTDNFCSHCGKAQSKVKPVC